jgi:CHAT domain-containing protein/Tfp pilus assembly protein PilF
VVLCLACITVPPSVPAPVPAPAEPLLDEGHPIERTLRGGERQEFRLAVEAGWYVRLEVEQIGVDVAASLLGPDGATLFSTDDPDGLEDREILTLIAPVAGELRLVVAPHDPQAAPGAYRAELAARRPAGPGDMERAAAQKALSEAWRRVRSQEKQERSGAVELYGEAARLWKEAGEKENEIDALNELGVLQVSLAEVRSALASCEQALSLSSEAGDAGREALSHNNLALAYQASGELDQALDHYQRALALWKGVNNIADQGRVLYSMGILHRDRGELDEAFRYLSEALPLRHAAGHSLGEIYTLLALAVVHQGRGEMEKASDRLQQAMELDRSTGGKAEGPVLATEAQFHGHRGEFGQALSCLLAARDIYRRTGNAGYEVRVLHQLGFLYLDLGDLDGAQEAFSQGLELVADNNSEGEARFLSSLGWSLYLRGDTEAALESLKKALDLSRRIDLPSATAQTLNQIGVIDVETGRAQEGLRLLQEELALRRKSGERAGEAKSLLDNGRAWQALGDLDQAAAAFRSALELGRRVGDTELVAAGLYRWALLDRQRGDLRQALVRIEEALQIIESVRSRVTSEKLRMTFLASKRTWYELYVDLQMRLEEAEPGYGHAAAALAASERARARGLLDLIAEGSIDVQQGIDPDLKKRETELGFRLSGIQEQLGRVTASSPESERAATLRTQLSQIGEEMERLEEEIRHRNPRYAEVRYPTPLRLEQIQSLLDQQTALLEYFVGRESSVLFFVTRESLSIHRLPAASTLAVTVQELRNTLARGGILSLGRFRRAAGDLYDVLLGPETARLARTPSLLISPDGPLHLIPFEALLTDPARGGSSYRDLSYLLRDHAISYVPSASVLDGLREQRPASTADLAQPKELIAFGDAIYPGEQVASEPVRSASPSFASLPGSEREVRAIADLYPGSAVALYTGRNATERNVKQNPWIQTARRIHFATHGFIDEARPQLSGLILTPEPDAGENGRLQVYEIFNLRLNADLVVLSACETALGEQVTGEGMVGLTRAFLYSGARSLLVSLWPVSDVSTPELMTSFYRHLGNSPTKAMALRRAKLERIDSGDEPFRWAPFILAGEPR